MDLKATVANGYRIRLILICAGALFFAAYFYYDATIGYPKQIEQYQEYLETKNKYPDNWQEKWGEIAKANDWADQPTERTEGDIDTQWLMCYITLPIGLYCLYLVVAWSRRYLGADETTLYAQGGVEVPFEKITSIDASRWQSKGIARVSYDTGSGTKQLVIDDWKLERTPTDAIFNRIRENVDPEKIEGYSEPDDDADDLDEPTQDAIESDEEKAASTTA